MRVESVDRPIDPQSSHDAETNNKHSLCSHCVRRILHSLDLRMKEGWRVEVVRAAAGLLQARTSFFRTSLRAAAAASTQRTTLVATSSSSSATTKRLTRHHGEAGTILVFWLSTDAAVHGPLAPAAVCCCSRGASRRPLIGPSSSRRGQ